MPPNSSFHSFVSLLRKPLAPAQRQSTLRILLRLAGSMPRTAALARSTSVAASSTRRFFLRFPSFLIEDGPSGAGSVLRLPATTPATSALFTTASPHNEVLGHADCCSSSRPARRAFFSCARLCLSGILSICADMVQVQVGNLGRPCFFL